jgi:hypothetical protein
MFRQISTTQYLIERGPSTNRGTAAAPQGSMKASKKLAICLAINVAVLGVVIALVTGFAAKSAYWRVGWGADLVIVSVKIDSPVAYCILLITIACINVTRVMVGELGMPILGFSVYNPDKKVITEFGKNELQFYANAMFLTSGLQGVFLALVSISQVDIAIWNVVTSEAASFVTIRMLLNEKEFRTEESDSGTEELGALAEEMVPINGTCIADAV